MKKFIFSFVFAFVSIVTFGQEWTSTDFEADELKGQDSYTAYSYTQPNVGSFIYWSNKKNQFRIVSYNQFFNYERDTSKDSYGCYITVGLYNENDVLIEKCKLWLKCFTADGKPTYAETWDNGAMFNPVGQAKKVKKIFEHLKTTGYIRIIADLYGNGEFDMKINHQ